MILYDTPRREWFRGQERLTAHLMSDLADPADARVELDQFARRIGLRHEWRQKSGEATEHYDLFDSRIDRARDAGAVEVPPRELITRVVRPRRAAIAGGGS